MKKIDTEYSQMPFRPVLLLAELDENSFHPSRTGNSQPLRAEHQHYRDKPKRAAAILSLFASTA